MIVPFYNPLGMRFGGGGDVGYSKFRRDFLGEATKLMLFPLGIFLPTFFAILSILGKKTSVVLALETHTNEYLFAYKKRERT